MGWSSNPLPTRSCVPVGFFWLGHLISAWLQQKAKPTHQGRQLVLSLGEPVYLPISLQATHSTIKTFSIGWYPRFDLKRMAWFHLCLMPHSGESDCQPWQPSICQIDWLMKQRTKTEHARETSVVERNDRMHHAYNAANIVWIHNGFIERVACDTCIWIGKQPCTLRG